MLGFMPSSLSTGEKAGVGEITLAPGAVRTLTVAAGAVVRVEAGIVWITQANDAFDYVVPAGGAFRADRGGRLVLQSLRGMAVVAV